MESCQVLRSTHSFPDHFHEEFYAIGIMEDGGSYCQGLHQERSFVAPRQLALIPPGMIHSGVPRPGMSNTYRMVYLGIDVMYELAADFQERDNGFPEFEQVVVPDVRSWGLLHCLSRLIFEGGMLLEKESLLASALSNLLAHHSGLSVALPRVGSEPRAMRIARELLRGNLAEKVSLAEVAREAGLSRYHFLRVFKQVTGMSPHAYRTLRRVEHAMGLLRKGLPISRVAQETGFSDQSHFTNTFKKFTAMTPSQYISS